MLATVTLAKLDFLIIDDWGQLPTDQWYQSIGDNTLADAILDLLMHTAHRIKLKGESMRKIQSELTDGEHLA